MSIKPFIQQTLRVKLGVIGKVNLIEAPSIDLS
jgi:hypothetical protein